MKAIKTLPLICSFSLNTTYVICVSALEKGVSCMSSFWGEIKKNIPNSLKLYKISVALLIFVFFTFYVGHALSKQSDFVPENPMNGYAEQSSQRMLVGDNSRSTNSSEPNLNVNQATNTEETKRTVEEKEVAEEKQQAKKEEEVSQTNEQAAFSSSDELVEDLNDSNSDNNRKEESNKKAIDSGTTQSSQQPKDNQNIQSSGNNQDASQSANTQNQPKLDNAQKPQNKEESKSEGTELKEKDDHHIEIVQPGNEQEELQANDYFTTTIIDQEIVTKKEYSFVVKQKQHDYTVNELSVSLNNQLQTDFSGSVTLEKGENDITVSITYQDQEGKVFTVSRDYTVILELGEIVIYSSLEQGMEATRPELIFTASAQRNDELLDVLVFANGEELTLGDDEKFTAELKKGENKIIISASDDSDQTVEQEFAVTYTPKETNIQIDTDLKNQEVAIPEFDFRAVAHDSSNKIGLTVEVNEELIYGNESGNYSVTLKEGNNKIILKAYNNDDALLQEYEVAYLKPIGEEASDVEVDENAPQLVTDLVDGTTIKGTIKTFNVWPVDHEGNRIRGNNVVVTANGVGVPFTWDDSTKTSYKLNLHNGKNEVTISVTDLAGRTTTETFYVHATEVAGGEAIGKATISIEASTIGLGYLIPPTEVVIHQGEKTSYLLDQLLRDNGFTYSHTGSLDEGFYLSAIQKPELVVNPVIPEDLVDLVRDASTQFDLENYDSDWLGEFDFANGSGWMYSVNGDYPNFGFSDSYLLDGDVVKIRYTLHYGKDIGGFGSMGGGAEEDWRKEW